MTDFLAVVVFCVSQQCGFYADTTTPYQNKAKCEKRAEEMKEAISNNGGSPILAGCIPIRFTKV